MLYIVIKVREFFIFTPSRPTVKDAEVQIMKGSIICFA